MFSKLFSLLPPTLRGDVEKEERLLHYIAWKWYQSQLPYQYNGDGDGNGYTKNFHRGFKPLFTITGFMSRYRLRMLPTANSLGQASLQVHQRIGFLLVV